MVGGEGERAKVGGEKEHATVGGEGECAIVGEEGEYAIVDSYSTTGLDESISNSGGSGASISRLGVWGAIVESRKMLNFYPIDMVQKSRPSGGLGVCTSPLLTKRLAKSEDADIADTMRQLEGSSASLLEFSSRGPPDRD